MKITKRRDALSIAGARRSAKAAPSSTTYPPRRQGRDRLRDRETYELEVVLPKESVTTTQ